MLAALGLSYHSSAWVCPIIHKYAVNVTDIGLLRPSTEMKNAIKKMGGSSGILIAHLDCLSDDLIWLTGCAVKMKQDEEPSSLTPLAQQLLTELKAVRTQTAQDENVRTPVCKLRFGNKLLGVIRSHHITSSVTRV